MRTLFLYILLVANVAVFSDEVTLKKDKTVLENVKTSQSSKTETLVEFKDGSKQTFKTSAITVVSKPIVWEEIPKEEPGFFSSLFGSSDSESEKSNTEETKKTEVSSKSVEGKEPEEEKGFFSKWFPELTMGTMAVLWLVLP
jgi:hypothetical protein